jgi:glycolate oxidase iron-sulfur subunit
MKDSCELLNGMLTDASDDRRQKAVNEMEPLLTAQQYGSIKVTVMKFDPTVDNEPFPATFEVPRQENMRIIDALDYIVEQLGQDIAYQWFCGAKKCGMCGVRMNGHSVLACWEAAEPDMLIEPLPGFPVVRDLVFDRSPYEASLARTTPLLCRSEPYRGFPESLRPAELAEVIGATQCIECQICTSVCPAYDVSDDFAGPATIVQIARVALDPRDPGNRAAELVAAGLDACLGCMACATACPTHVPYQELLPPLRDIVEQAGGRPGTQRLLRGTIHRVVVGRRRMAFALRLGSLGRRLPMPTSLRAISSLMPTRPAKQAQLPEVTKASGNPLGKVALLRGCVQSVVFSDVNLATARVLAAEGYDVYAPRDQGCCGALSMHSGRRDEALALAKRLVDRLGALEVDFIVTNVAGCGSHLKELGHALRADPEYHEKALRLAAKARDVNELLANEGVHRSVRHPLPLKVAYQDACHLLHAQGIREAPRQMLRSIPELTILEPKDQGRCCGSAGIYNLVRPTEARRLGHEKALRVLEVAPEAYASANAGCLLQVTAALRRRGQPLPAFHPIELVDASIRGVSVDQLLAGSRR